MSEAHGKARLENQVKMLVMGTKMLRRQARREEKVLRKREEVSERRGGGEWERLSSQPGEQASPPSAQTCTAGTTEQRGPGRAFLPQVRGTS